MESERGYPRLIHDKIHFLLLLPLKEPCDRSAPTGRRFPRDFRIGIAGLIFPQALELASVSGPGRLLRGDKHAVNRAAQNAPAARAANLASIRKGAGISNHRRRRQNRRRDCRSTPTRGPGHRPRRSKVISRRPRPELGWLRLDDNSRAVQCRQIRPSLPIPDAQASATEARFSTRNAVSLSCVAGIIATRMFSAHPAPPRAGECEWNLDGLPLAPSQAFSRQQRTGAHSSRAEPQTRWRHNTPATRPAWRSARTITIRARTMAQCTPTRASTPMIHTSDSCGLKSDPAGRSAICCASLATQKRVASCWFRSSFSDPRHRQPASCTTTPAKLSLTAVMISLASILPPDMLLPIRSTAVLPPPPAPR